MAQTEQVTIAQFGRPLTIGAVTVKARCMAVDIGKVGLGFLARAGLGAYSATADPRQFSVLVGVFSGPKAPPMMTEESIVVYDGRGYVLTRVETYKVDDLPISVKGFGHRVLMSADPDLQPVFPTELDTLWRPVPSGGLGQTLRPNDVSYSNEGQIPAFFVPMMPGDQGLPFGMLDVRTNHVFTNDPLKLSDILWRPDQREAWQVISPSEVLPGSGLIVAVAKHMQVPPKQIAS